MGQGYVAVSILEHVYLSYVNDQQLADITEIYLQSS